MSEHVDGEISSILYGSEPSPTADVKNELDNRNWSQEHGIGSISNTTSRTKIGEDEKHTAPDGSTDAAPTTRRRLQFREIRATGPSRIFNPTNIRVNVGIDDGDDGKEDTNSPSAGISRATTRRSSSHQVALQWNSRDNRKRRNSVAVSNPGSRSSESLHPAKYKRHRVAASFKNKGIGIWKMCTTFAYWDLAFWSGWSYSVGSVLFILDGVFAWMPVAYPGLDFGADTVGVLFFVGAMLYQLGATVAYFEAVNDGSFHGSALRRFMVGQEEDHKEMIDKKLHAFFGYVVPHQRKEKKDLEAKAGNVDPEAGWNARDRAERPGSIYPPGKKPGGRRGGMDLGADVEKGEVGEYTAWRWWPTWHCLRTHHIYEIGYIACSIQLVGATLYTIAGLVGLPGIFDTLEHQWQVNFAYWIPQIVASVCFLGAGLLFTLETQEKWYKPEPKVIGWWIGFWASVGSVGFLLSASFGPPSFDNSTAAYQSPLSSIWGSVAYLLSGLYQWYEAINKNPVEELLNEPGPMKSFQIHGI